MNTTLTRPGVPSIVAARSARIVVALLALGWTAGVVPPGKPEDVGLSSDRLQRSAQVMQRSNRCTVTVAGGVTRSW